MYLKFYSLETLDPAEIIEKFPVIFIDEFDKEKITLIKLFRNLSRVMVVPSILSSTNSTINNMIESSSTSTITIDYLWVHVVRKLMKANIAAVTETAGIESIFLEDDSIKLPELLQSLNISSNRTTLAKLRKIVLFLFDQARTSLQGTSAFMFEFFYQELCSQRNGTLNPDQIWTSMCASLIHLFTMRKSIAFNEKGLFCSLRMFSVNRNYIEGRDTSDIEMTEEDVTNSIDNHFYYFGSNTPGCLISFNFNASERRLVLGNVDYKMSSYYSLLENDFFTTLALWHINLSKPTVAFVVNNNRQKIIDILPNDNALSNDFRAQETMSYWSIGSSSHQNLCGQTSASEFLSYLIGNVQITAELVPFELNRMCGTLLNFLSNIRIPYLIPKDSRNLKRMLAGICNLGVCERCPNSTGFDIKFDIFQSTRKKSAFVECKYTGSATNRTVLNQYLAKAKEKKLVLTFLICYNLHDQLKKKYAIRKPSSSTSRPKRPIPNEFDINIYSVFDNQMICLAEYINPKGVLIIIHSNLQVPRI